LANPGRIQRTQASSLACMGKRIGFAADDSLLASPQTDQGRHRWCALPKRQKQFSWPDQLD